MDKTAQQHRAGGGRRRIRAVSGQYPASIRPVSGPGRPGICAGAPGRPVSGSGHF